jgi:hypothetical protein
MGLTIHYSARLKSLDLLPQFTSEVADICQSIGWEYDKVDKTVKMKDTVSFSPPLDNNKTGLINSFKGALEKEGWTVTHEPFSITTKMDDLLDAKDKEVE